MNDREVRAGTLSIRTHHNGSICTVALAGELDLANAEEFSDELERRRLVLPLLTESSWT